jgi:ribulose-phosphate 3-epimerase
VVEAGAEWLHFAVHDGRMVPEISFGSPIVSALRGILPTTVFDVKLGVMDPERRIREFKEVARATAQCHTRHCPMSHPSLPYVTPVTAICHTRRCPMSPVATLCNTDIGGRRHHQRPPRGVR